MNLSDILEGSIQVCLFGVSLAHTNEGKCSTDAWLANMSAYCLLLCLSDFSRCLLLLIVQHIYKNHVTIDKVVEPVRSAGQTQSTYYGGGSTT